MARTVEVNGHQVVEMEWNGLVSVEVDGYESDYPDLESAEDDLQKEE